MYFSEISSSTISRHEKGRNEPLSSFITAALTVLRKKRCENHIEYVLLQLLYKLTMNGINWKGK